MARAGPAARLSLPSAAAWRGFGIELALAVAGALIYFAVRGGVTDRAAEAIARGAGLAELERSLGLFWEPAMQGWILSSRPLIDLMNGIYFWAHMPLIVVVAVALYWRRRALYRLIRNAFLISALIALALYFAFPVAPPRFFPELGFVDTMALYATANYQAQEAGPFVNPYAALPSLHFGWALLIGAAIWMARPRGRAGTVLAASAGALLLAGQFFAVVMTGNHFVLDLPAGAAVAAAGFGLAWIWRRPLIPLMEGGDGLERRVNLDA